MTIDPNEAPPGCKAVPEERERGCRGCAFRDRGLIVCWPFSCIGEERIDGHNVIFIKEEEPNDH